MPWKSDGEVYERLKRIELHAAAVVAEWVNAGLTPQPGDVLTPDAANALQQLIHAMRESPGVPCCLRCRVAVARNTGYTVPAEEFKTLPPGYTDRTVLLCNGCYKDCIRLSGGNG